MKVESCIIVDSTSFGPRKKSGQEKKFLGLVQIESKAIEGKAIHENKAMHYSKAILSIPLNLSRDKIWREKIFLGLVQLEIDLLALLSFCTKPRKNFSRQILSLDKPSGIDNT